MREKLGKSSGKIREKSGKNPGKIREMRKWRHRNGDWLFREEKGLGIQIEKREREETGLFFPYIGYIINLKFRLTKWELQNKSLAFWHRLGFNFVWCSHTPDVHIYYKTACLALCPIIKYVFNNLCGISTWLCAKINSISIYINLIIQRQLFKLLKNLPVHVRIRFTCGHMFDLFGFSIS